MQYSTVFEELSTHLELLFEKFKKDYTKQEELRARSHQT